MKLIKILFIFLFIFSSNIFAGAGCSTRRTKVIDPLPPQPQRREQPTQTAPIPLQRIETSAQTDPTPPIPALSERIRTAMIPFSHDEEATLETLRKLVIENFLMDSEIPIHSVSISYNDDVYLDEGSAHFILKFCPYITKLKIRIDLIKLTQSDLEIFIRGLKYLKKVTLNERFDWYRPQALKKYYMHQESRNEPTNLLIILNELNYSETLDEISVYCDYLGIKSILKSNLLNKRNIIWNLEFDGWMDETFENTPLLNLVHNIDFSQIPKRLNFDDMQKLLETMHLPPNHNNVLKHNEYLKRMSQPSVCAYDFF
ncbi:TPA: hypothetical protein DEO28_00470 [Candidatus Dependentiae bacterium]|nr:MAG: hypothetical protein UR14_C0001G0055 [candidate division TM6 bacterium GW2011_GWE2_31_21]KKP54065.1 MAG: hypothetical protein UR43_C0001G0083 [candidate division TM6 bacterium GW2011_GWF2_33_332]HBS48353.1 hypothetical protein [Candidatus Dependentiae bacterium]HBZ72973.1 hypothetical protein [Candidatus Dependentiae bacterium]